MKSHSPGTWRYDFAFGVLVLVLAGMCVRLALLVRDGSASAAEITRKQQRMVIPQPGIPGYIYARAGGAKHVLLAGSKLVPGCFADPAILKDDEVDDVAVRLGAVLRANPARLREDIMSRRKSRFVWLNRDITPEQAKAVKALRLAGIGIKYEKRREYPNKSLGASVVGFRMADHRPGGGVELSCRKYLAAVDGVQEVLTDAFRRPIWSAQDRSRSPVDGSNVYLCMDAVIQGYLEQAVGESVEKFGAKWGTGVVVNPHSGEILAICSLPTFDPNHFNTASAESRTNHAVVSPYEPGSIFKPIIAAAAVDAGIVTYQTKIFCENGVYYALRGGRITDHGKCYGYLSLTDVEVFSSNIGMTKIGEMLGNEGLFEAVGRFGFGQKTGIELPAEDRGTVRPLGRWDGYSMRRVPFGQEIAVTSVQLAMAFGALANGGLLLRPRLLDRVTDPGGSVIWQARRQVVRRVLRPSTAAQTLSVLEQVVQRGTGKACRMRRWTSFGKTGTAQIAGEGGYADGAYVGSFIGGAPASKPAVLCLISIYYPDRSRGYYGSIVAAPYVKRVLEQTLSYLDVAPDRETYVARADVFALQGGRRE